MNSEYAPDCWALVLCCSCVFQVTGLHKRGPPPKRVHFFSYAMELRRFSFYNLYFVGMCILYCYSILSFGPWYCFVPLCFRSVQEQRGPPKAKTPLYKYRLSLFVVISMSLYVVNILLWGVLRFPFEPTYSTTGMLSRGFGAGILCNF